MTCTSTIPELAAPALANAGRSGINITGAARLEVLIAPYPGMNAGDLIELFWDNCYVGSRLLTEADTQASVTLRVPESFIVNGTSRIHYRVMRVGGGAARGAPPRGAGAGPRCRQRIGYRSNSTAPAANRRPRVAMKTRGWHRCVFRTPSVARG